ncbi:ankyrin repeat family protein [Turkeypox virus]|uniref:Ankyrin repeat family protein n=1 Tax=Turkeypox virus TaxID=336486 RepID=A0A0M5I1B0_9POXV|nr:ankyrin repeat family protein [Turkeypox virus]ALA62383.1 ankyrin repeat family protein [Turkeypox virus]
MDTGNKYCQKELHNAIRMKDVNSIRSILERNIKEYKKPNNLSSALSLAVSCSSTDIARILLEHGADINKCKGSPLHRAVNMGNIQLVKILLEYGASVDRAYHSNSPLYIALCRNNIDMARCLLENGADPNNLFLGYSDIYEKLSVDMYKLLIEFNIDINIQDKYCNTPIYYAIRNMNMVLVKLLLGNNANVKQESEYHTRPYLNTLIDNNCDSEIVKLFIEKGVSINIKDDLGRTPLHCSVNTGRYDITSLLIDLGANINAVDSILGTPLHYSIINNDLQVTKLLLDRGADTNIYNNHIDTVLNIAVSYKDKYLIGLLLEKGADIRLKGKEDPVIHRALDTKDQDIILQVLNCGADINAKNRSGNTALYIAVSNSRIDTVKTLLENGADPNIKNDIYNNTPLHLSMMLNKIEITELLLLYNADINALNSYGCTPLTCTTCLDDKVASILVSRIVLRISDNVFSCMAGFQINMDFIKQHSRLSHIMNRCEIELEMLKELRLSSNHSLDIFLRTENLNTLARLVNHPKVKKLYPLQIYKKLMHRNRGLAINRYYMISRAVEASRNLDMISKIPDDIKYLIMEMLDNNDLRSVISASSY